MFRTDMYMEIGVVSSQLHLNVWKLFFHTSSKVAYLWNTCLLRCLSLYSSYCFVNNPCSARANINWFGNQWKSSTTGVKYYFTVTCRSCICFIMSERTSSLICLSSSIKKLFTVRKQSVTFLQCKSSKTLCCVRRARFFYVQRQLW
jgi:hypothetical protein